MLENFRANVHRILGQEGPDRNGSGRGKPSRGRWSRRVARDKMLN